MKIFNLSCFSECSPTYLEIAHVVVPVKDSDVGGFLHEVGALVEAEEFAHLAQNEDGRGHRVHGHDVALVVDGQSRNDVDEADGDGVAAKKQEDR